MSRRSRKKKQEDESGHVYVLVNSAMPGVVKIGRTGRDVAKRVSELNSASGVPVPFRVAGAVRTSNTGAVERRIHERLSGRRLNRRREFFRCSPQEALAIARSVASESGARFVRGERYRNNRRRPLRPPFMSALAATAAGAAWLCLYSPPIAGFWLLTCLHSMLTGHPRPLADVLSLPSVLGAAGFAGAVLAAAVPAILIWPPELPAIILEWF